MMGMVWESVLSTDTALLRSILSMPHPEWLNRVFAAASMAGIGGAIWIAMGAVLAAARRIGGRDFVMIVTAIVLVHVVVDLVLKPTIARSRPAVPVQVHSEEERPRTPSFPSGHAAVARVYLGVHYPLDALAGALIGLVCGRLVLSWLPAIRSPAAHKPAGDHRRR